MFRAVRGCLSFAGNLLATFYFWIYSLFTGHNPLKVIPAALALAAALAAPLPALAAWAVELGQPWKGRPLYYSVAWLGATDTQAAAQDAAHDAGGGWVMGSYGGGLIARSDAYGAVWKADWLTLPLDDRPDSESISLFMPMRWGLLAFTEDPLGPQGWRYTYSTGALELAAEIGGGMEYALGGPWAAALGLVPISTGHQRMHGAYVAGPDGRPLTPGLWDGDTPLVMWDATVAPAGWGCRYVAGCSLGLGQYLEDGVGRLALYDGTAWRLAKIPPMPGVTRAVHHPAYPGCLFLATTHGQVWLAHGPDGPFELFHDQDTGRQHGAYVHNWRGHVVVSNAAGGVWCDLDGPGRLVKVAQVPGVDFMSLAPGITPAGTWQLTGPVHKDGVTVPVVIKPE